MKKVLIIAPSWIGDMVMAQALLRLLKFQFPDVQIDVLALAWCKPILARMPEVTKAITMPIGHGKPLKIGPRYRLGKSLRSENYDTTFVLQNSVKAAFMPFFAKIPNRIGWGNCLRAGWLNKRRVLDKAFYPLMVERYMALALPEKEVPEVESFRPKLIVDADLVEKAVAKYDLDIQRPVLILCPGAQFGETKRWPEEYFAKLVDHYKQEGWSVWLLGGPGEKELVANINKLAKVAAIDLTQTSLAEAVDLLSLASVVVSNDSGLMHIACALAKPLVAIFGSTSPGHTPPLDPQAQVLNVLLPCKPCLKRECPLKHLRCLRDITPDQVIEAVGKQV
jgi:heptosyltransferase II